MTPSLRSPNARWAWYCFSLLLAPGEVGTWPEHPGPVLGFGLQPLYRHTQGFPVSHRPCGCPTPRHCAAHCSAPQPRPPRTRCSSFLAEA